MLLIKFVSILYVTFSVNIHTGHDKKKDLFVVATGVLASKLGYYNYFPALCIYIYK